MIWFIYIVCASMFVASFFTDTSVLGYSLTSPAWCRLTYMFCHRSFLHFAGNMVALYFCHRSAKRLGASYTEWLIVPVCFLATFMSEQVDVTVGISGGVYMYLGVILTYYNKKEYIFSLAIVFAVNLLLYKLQNSNFMVHGLAFIYGYLISQFTIWNKQRKTTAQD